MKITCLQENLKTSLNIVQNIIGRNLTLPILNNILVQTEGGRLKISSTNLEIGINTWSAGKIEKEGAITCPAKILTGFINSLPNKKIDLETKGETLVVRCENYKVTLKGLPAEDFPLIPKIKEPALIEIEANILRQGLAQVVQAAALSESRPEITGILFKIERNSLILAATDSFRLAEKTILDVKKEGELSHSIIIPQRTVQELIRILSEQNSSVKMVLGNNQILFEMEDIQVISRIIDGQYPDYQQIIPKSFLTQAVMERDELLNLIRIAGLFSSKINDIKISLRAGRLEILSQDPDLGENKSYLEAEIKGKEIETTFNYRYLLEGLINIGTKKVFLGMNSETSPAILKPQEAKENYLYVVMPIRLN